MSEEELNENQEEIEELSVKKEIKKESKEEEKENSFNYEKNEEENTKKESFLTKVKKFFDGTLEYKKETNSTNIEKIIPSDVIRYQPDIGSGLTDQQVKDRIDNNLTNRDENTNSQSIGKIILRNTLTFFNILEFAIFLTLLCFQLWTQTIFFGVILINLLIGIFQEIKSKKTIDKLKLVNMQSVSVIRDGKTVQISSDDLVLDDIYLIKIGDQIPTDGIILDGQLEVNESLLTGESLPIKKGIDDEIMAGSYVVSGSATIKANKVGKFNYANGLQAKVKTVSKRKSELTKSLNTIIKVVSIIIIPLGCALFATQWMELSKTTSIGFEIAKQDISSTAGSLISMIPAGMYLLISVALAVGAMTLAKKQTLVQDLFCIEMLARVNTLCLDKTGTLTDGTMRVADIKILDKTTDLYKVMGSFLNSFKESNQTSAALANVYPFNNEYQASIVLPFSSKRKLSAVTFRDYATFILGAPEYVLDNLEEYETITSYIKTMQKKGYRIVLLARTLKELKGQDMLIQGKLKPIAVFALEDHVREEAPDTIKWFVENEVDIKIISGDDPLTASEIAKKCQVPNAQKCISLKGMPLSELKEIVTEYTVFGRVSPEQKAFIIETLKEKGKTVGMTGDGVNDILAMKSSDCSIAMANGSNAAKNVAHLVLLDSNFASMPCIVAEGRRVINNIQRSSSLFLMKTLFAILFTIICISLKLKYPFTTNNMMLFEVVGIGIPSFFLALQKNNQIIRGNFIKNTLSRALPAALCMIFALSLNYTFKMTDFLGIKGYAGEAESFTTFNVITITLVALIMVYSCCYPLNRYRSILNMALWVIFIVWVFAIPLIPSLSSPPESYLIIYEKTNIPYSLSMQFTGIDFRFLNKTQALLLVIYASTISLLLNILNHFFAKIDKDNGYVSRDLLSFKK